MKNGFLLVELLIALAILSGLTLIVSSQIWQTIKLHKNAELRLAALNHAISALDGCLTQQKKLVSKQWVTDDGMSITLERECNPVDQGAVDSLLSPASKESIADLPYEPVLVRVEWNSLSNKQEVLTLKTFVLRDKKTDE